MSLSDHQVDLLTQSVTFAGVVFAGVRSYMNALGQAKIKVLVDGTSEELRADVIKTRQEVRDLNAQFMEYLKNQTTDKKPEP